MPRSKLPMWNLPPKRTGSRARPPTPPPKPSKELREWKHQHQHQPQQQHRHQHELQHQHPPDDDFGSKNLQRPKQQRQRQQDTHHPSDEYLLSAEDADLYAARLNYLKKKPHAARTRVQPVLSNASAAEQVKTILTYHRNSHTPTKDLQVLVLLLAREQINGGVKWLSGNFNDQNPYEMRNMRLNSFISNTPDLMDYSKAAMLEESMRIIAESLEHDRIAWATANAEAERNLPMPMDMDILVAMPPDKPEISKSQVAAEYIQAQRGHQSSQLEDPGLLFQNELLRSENAAGATPEIFDQICTCLRLVVQKAVEIQYIEKKPETRQAVANYVEQMKASVERVIQDLIKQDLDEAVSFGGTFAHILIGLIMNDLHAIHRKNDYEPMKVTIECGKNK